MLNKKSSHKLKKVFASALIAASSLLVLAGCSNSNKSSKSSSSKQLTVAVYSGDWQKNIQSSALNDFTKKTGIKVNVVPGADAEWLTKLNANKGKTSPYDVMILQPDTIERAASANLLQKLDSKEVSNLKNLYPTIQDKLKYDGNQYAAGFSVGQLGIAYRKDLVKNPPKSWSDLWKSEYKGHIAISPLTYSAGLQTFSGIINSQGGKESNPKDVQKAFSSLKKLKSSITSYPDNPGALQTLLQRGDAWIEPNWDGRIFSLQKTGLDLGFTYPKDGSVAAVASWAVAKDSANKDAAYKLVNYLSSPDVQKKFSDKSFYGMANKDVKYSKNIKDKIKTGEKELSSLKWVDYNTTFKELKNWTDEWNETLGGN